MRTIGNNIVVTRGEVFVLARDIVYRNGAPYVLRSQLENPYLLITISSNTYRMKGKYFRRYWLDLSTYPAFDTAEVKDITEEQLTSNTLPDNYTATTCIYRFVTTAGESEYYRYVGTSPNGTYQSYSFSFVKTFLNTDTRDWIESNYLYEIQIVSGQKTVDYVTNTWNSLFSGQPVPDTVEDMYCEIMKERPDLLKGVSLDNVLVNFTSNDIILSPSKITINANA